MTFVGKFFVMFNVALSLFWAVMAFGLYATSIDWGYDPSKPGTPGGILKTRTDEIKELQALQGPVEASWRAARAELRNREELRRGDRQFYAAQIEYNRDKANETTPVRTVVL